MQNFQRFPVYEGDGFIVREDTRDAAESTSAGSADGAGEAQGILERPALESPGQKPRRKSIAGPGFINRLDVEPSRTERLVPLPRHRAGFALSNNDGAVWIDPCQNLGLIGRVLPAGQRAGLILIGQKNIGVRQNIFNAGQPRGGPRRDHDIQSRN